MSHLRVCRGVYPTWQKYISSGTNRGLNAIADERIFAIEYKKAFIFDMVKKGSEWRVNINPLRSSASLADAGVSGKGRRSMMATYTVSVKRNLFGYRRR